MTDRLTRERIEQWRSYLRATLPLSTSAADELDVICNRAATQGMSEDRVMELSTALSRFAALGGPDDGCAAAYNDLDDDAVIYENSGKCFTAGDVRRARKLVSKYYQPHPRRASQPVAQAEPVAWRSSDWKVICRAQDKGLWPCATIPLHENLPSPAQPVSEERILEIARDCSQSLEEFPEAMCENAIRQALRSSPVAQAEPGQVCLRCGAGIGDGRACSVYGKSYPAHLYYGSTGGKR